MAINPRNDALELRQHGDEFEGPELTYPVTGRRFGAGGGGGGASVHSRPKAPRQATSEEDIALQRSLMNDEHHEAIIVIDFVDSNLGVAEAHELESGKQVSLTWNTLGFAKETLSTGDKVKAFVTELQVAVRVEATAS